MKFYLSSYKLGKDTDKLKEILPANKKTAYISNALDGIKSQDWLSGFIKEDIGQLTNLGLNVKPLDLKHYFLKQTQLTKDILSYGMLWISGGNVFNLRRAMYLSGLDKLLMKLNKNPAFIYGGYSAGICVLSPSLKGLELVDSPNSSPYQELTAPIWQGINLINYAIVPHYRSDHPESKKMEAVVKYYQEKKKPHKTLKDGEVIIINQTNR